MAAAPIFLVHLARKPRCANAWEDAIDCSYRFILNWPIALEAVEDDHRPVFSGNTVVRVFWSWSPFATHRRRAGIMGFIVSQQVLYLEIQVARRGKEEGANW